MRALVLCLLVLVLSVPAHAAPITITTATDLQAAITANATGTIFLLEAGTHRRGSITPKDGNVFIGVPGAILSGGELLTGWTAAGSDWYVGGQTQGSLQSTTNCIVGFEACRNREDVFYDDVPLVGVTTLGALGPGKFFFDYAADRIYIRDTPSGHTVETSVRAAAFIGTAQHVTVRGLQIEKYASPLQDGAIETSTTSHGWLIEENTIRHSHGYGLRIKGNNWVVRGNTISNNGQMGIGGSGTKNVLITDNVIADNNYAKVSSGFEAGGVKMTVSRGLRYVRNRVTNNYGKGLWCDISCVDVLYDSNVVTGNADTGLSWEISYHAVIRHNVSSGNGWDVHGSFSGGGLKVSNSERTEVFGNVVQVGVTGNAFVLIQQNRTGGMWGDAYRTRFSRVHHNTIRYAAGTTFDFGYAGTLDDHLADITELGTTWDHNLVFVNAAATVWVWEDCYSGGATYATLLACGVNVHGARYNP